MAIDKITIVHPSAKLKTNRNTMPPMTAATAIETDIKIDEQIQLQLNWQELR